MTPVQAFAATLQAQQLARIVRDYPNIPEPERMAAVRITEGPKYTRVDVGDSGKYMVENSSGAIYGIKGYGVIHRGHAYGTLATVSDWDWSGYSAVRRG